MNTERKSAIYIGLLILLSTSSFMIGDIIIMDIAAKPDYLSNTFPNTEKMGFGSLLQLVNNIAVVGIGIVFYSILSIYNQRIAFIYLIARIIEGVLLCFSVAILLCLVPLSEAYIQADKQDISYFETIGTILKTARYQMFQVAMISLSIGSFFMCYLLYQTKLIPRLMTILGFIGYGLLLFKVVTEILGYELGGQTLYIPGALFEFLLPLWLIFKGFNLSSKEAIT